MKSANEKLKQKLCGMLYVKWLKKNTKAAERKMMVEIPENVRSAFVRTETGEQRWCIRSEWVKEDGNRDYTSQTMSFSVPEPLLFPGTQSTGSLNVTIEKGDRFYELFSEICRNNVQITEHSSQIRREVDAVIRANATVEKLLRVWPEVKELLPEGMLNPAPKVHLPAFNPAKLNNVIGLPSDKKIKGKKAA
ncbi:MAG: Nmad5 family putative nucleotide modification protein [Hyphomonas sp.]|nr:Nmad5 family putative nucleotide modification protein [Hyphomonas sp.]